MFCNGGYPHRTEHYLQFRAGGGPDGRFYHCAMFLKSSRFSVNSSYKRRYGGIGKLYVTEQCSLSGLGLCSHRSSVRVSVTFDSKKNTTCIICSEFCITSQCGPFCANQIGCIIFLHNAMAHLDWQA